VSAQAARLFAMLSVAAVLAGCPDGRTPKVPTTPKVPEPKADVVPSNFASHIFNMAPALPGAGSFS
jgi:ABC-type uncharacterized transport system auxiliary subunit